MPAPHQPTPQDPTAPQIVLQPALNWLHFRPRFGGKPDEDVKAHLLHTNDWMNTHNFPVDVKVQRFSLKLVGEDRLWYGSLRLIASDWPALQKQF